MDFATGRGRAKAAPVLALLAAAVAALGVSAAPARAADPVCSGSLLKGPPKDSENPSDHRIEFAFSCQTAITGFSIVTDQTVEHFDTDLLVYGPNNGALVPADSFGCEGDIPGLGFHCTGAYSGNGETVKGAFLTTAGVCVEPKVHALLVVSNASKDAKGNPIDTFGGPFDMGRPVGCPAHPHSGKHKGTGKQRGAKKGKTRKH